MSPRRLKFSVLALLSAAAMAAHPGAARAGGNLYGTVVGEDGSPLPGVTVTLGACGGPAVQVTDAQGRFRYLDRFPGSCSVRAELEGFATIEYPNVVLSDGRDTTIEITLTSTLEDVITVTFETPLLDERRIITGTTVTATELEAISTARDPWATLQSKPGVLGDRLNIACIDGHLTHLPTQNGSEYFAKATFDVPAGWGFGYVSVFNGKSTMHFGSVDDDCKLNPKAYTRSGGNLHVVDSGPEYEANLGFRYAAFFARDTGGGSEIRAMGFNVDDHGRYFFGKEVRIAANAEAGYNLAPRADLNSTNGKLALAFGVCSGVNQGCQDTRTAVLDPADFSVLPGSTYQLHLNPPDQFVPLGNWVQVGPDGDFLVTYTRSGPSALLMGGQAYGPFGVPGPAGPADFFPSLPGSQFGGIDSIVAGAESWVVLGQQFSNSTFSSYVTTVPFGGPLVPTTPVRVGTTSPEFTNPQLFDNWKTFGITSSAALQPIQAAAVAGPGLFEQQLTLRQPCHPGPTRLCLGGGRFQVNVSHFSNGAVGEGTAFFLSDDTGYFTFFDPANVELLVKVIDGCGLGGNYWVFAGGLTDVRAVVTVTDLSTGQRVQIKNAPGTPFAPYQNTAAFACGPAASAAWASPSAAPAPGAVTAPATDCTSDSTHLCLNGGRFRVSAEWKTGDGQAGPGKAVALSAGGPPDTGYFWFFAEGNVEMIVKVLNGCTLNNRYWVFAGGLTNVEVTTTVRDTKTGSVRTYTNPQGRAFEPVQDTAALATCP